PDASCPAPPSLLLSSAPSSTPFPYTTLFRSSITSGSLAFGDVLSGSLPRESGESVAGSPYAIKQGSLTAGTNYDLTYVGANFTRSEEHTSELQSRRELVCRLLLATIKWHITR